MSWLTAEQALGLLGTKSQTLYANVSRGRIRAKADPSDTRRSLYFDEDVKRLATRHAGRTFALRPQSREHRLDRFRGRDDPLAPVAEVFRHHTPSLSAINHSRVPVSLLPWDGFITCPPRRALLRRRRRPG